jgi:NAD(P)H dehydrogenase (quinone)
MTKLAIVYHSGYGHTAKVADHVKQGLLQVKGIEVTMLTAAEACEQLDVLDTMDGIIMGCPTYMGSASAAFKQFMEASSKRWIEQKWRDKLAAGFTNSGSLNGDKASTMQQLVVFAGQHGMIWISFGHSGFEHSQTVPNAKLDRLGSDLGLMTQSDNGSAEETPGPLDLETARYFGHRIATVALKLTGKVSAPV